MPKANKTCANCVLCENSEFGLSKCTLWQKEGNVIFPENKACKMITGRVNLRHNKKTEPEYGDAPFCGDFPKCNNAEGCDRSCREFDEFLEEWYKKQGE